MPRARGIRARKGTRGRGSRWVAGRAAAFRLTRAEERRLLAAARAGDRRALSRLLELLSGPIYRFGRGFCGDPHDAEDVAQVTLAALARTLRDFRGDSSLTTWAYTVARNACTRHRRRGAGEPARLEPLDARGSGRSAALQVADPGEDPQRALERAELRATLERAIASLPPAQREVLVLRDVEGLPAKQVGKILGLGERAVKSRLHRARVALREALAPHLPVAAPGAPAQAKAGRCPDVARVMSRYLEDELDAGACAKLEAHVRSCPSCGAACETLRAALGTCSGWRAEKLPAEVREAVREAIREVVAVARTKS
ncbi:MAG: sigma-70 family RNA polymerase sigma factor [Candidatus Eisenbacteria bacterium]|nr:sigma-70 family RNA polymerase sigma factor [Candidatus Eisenbacteria bacterium]